MDAFDLVPRSRRSRLAWALFPGTCTLCHQRSSLPLDLCATCLADLPWNEGACTSCGLSSGASDSPCPACPACLARPPPFVRTVAPLRYRGLAVDLIHALKLGRSRVGGRVLATVLGAAVQRAYEGESRPDLIVPVPMSWRRLLQHGRNHAALLALQVGRELDIAVDCERCRRVRHTPRQTGSSRRERLRSLNGAFACTGSLEGRRVAIVDDVMTTSATMRAMCRAVIAQGASEVHAWVVARTERVTAP